MYFLKTWTLPIVLICTLNIKGMSQDASPIDSSLLVIPPLTDIISAALHYSPMLRAQSAYIEANRQEMNLSKKKWADYVFIEGAVNYGMYDQITLNSNNTENDVTSGLLTKTEQVRYYTGVGVKLPVSQVINRKNEVKINQIKIKQAHEEYLQLIKDLKQMLIEEYYKLLYLEESVRTFHAIYQTLEISRMKAEREVSRGYMDINQFALLSSTVGKAKNDYAKAKHEFYAQYHKLQDLTGIIF